MNEQFIKSEQFRIEQEILKAARLLSETLIDQNCTTEQSEAIHTIRKYLTCSSCCSFHDKNLVLVCDGKVAHGPDFI